ncbi:MAG: hypothetical protein UHD64_01015 [Bacteroidales bacterium]|nr:hypothetical protein [Bacteroidales bacterium]
MLVIKMNVRNQRLSRYTSGVVAEGSYGYLKFEFNFKTDDWNGVTSKTAVFSYGGKNSPPIKLDANNQCYVPKEVIKAPSFKVSVYGGGITTNTVKIPVEVNGSFSDDDDDSDVNTAPPARIIDISLPADKWIGDESPYYQILIDDDITSSSKVDLQPSPEQLCIFHDKDLAFTTGNEEGTVKIYSIGDKPTNDYVIQATITEVALDE